MIPLDTTQLGAFLVAGVALVGSPGPATLGLAGAGAAFGLIRARIFFAGMLCGAAISITLVGSGVVAAVLVHPVIGPTLIGIAALYLFYLAFRIATAAPLGEQATRAFSPGFTPGLLLALSNPKAYAVFGTLFSGFVVVPGDVGLNALVKGVLIMALLTLIDFCWLVAGSLLCHVFQNPIYSQRINIGFAVLLFVSVGLALLV